MIEWALVLEWQKESQESTTLGFYETKAACDNTGIEMMLMIRKDGTKAVPARATALTFRCYPVETTSKS